MLGHRAALFAPASCKHVVSFSHWKENEGCADIASMKLYHAQISSPKNILEVFCYSTKSLCRPSLACTTNALLNVSWHLYLPHLIEADDGRCMHSHHTFPCFLLALRVEIWADGVNSCVCR